MPSIILWINRIKDTNRMQFSNFTRTEGVTEIKFYTATPLIGITDIKYFKDDSSGTFTKKEFRWSFNGDYWASWEVLNQGNLAGINIDNNPYLFLEIRYISTGGTVETFTLHYAGAAQSETTSETCPPDSDYVSPDNSIRPEVYDPTNQCATTSTDGIDAATLCGKPCDYYLWRPNHKGEQPITSITDLQKILSNMAGKIQNIAEVDGSNMSTEGIGVFYEKQGSDLLFRTLDVSGHGIEIAEQDGVIYFTVDASFSFDDASINELYDFYYSLEGDLHDLSVYVDAKFLSVDASIIRMDSSINDLYSRLDTSTGVLTLENIGGGSGLIFKQLSSGVAQLRTIEGSGIIDVSTVGDQIIITADTSGLTVDTSVKNIVNVGTGTGEILAEIDASGTAKLRRLKGTGDVSIGVQGDDIVIYIDADVSISADPWIDPDPVSADVGGIQGGDYVSLGSSPRDVLEDILYEYFPPNVSMQIDPLPGPTSSTGYYEKWVDTPIASGAKLTYSFNNDDFVKNKVYDVSIYENGSYLRTDGWGGLSSIPPYATTDSSPPVGTASIDLIYTFNVGNGIGGNNMPTYDISTALFWTDPYFYGTVPDTVNASNITNADILGLDKLIVPEQSNEIVYDVSSNYVKTKFVYAYPASYDDVKSIFDVKNDFNVTTSFDSSIVNVKMSGISGPGPYIQYKVYIKSHWISFTEDVSTFKLNFNI